MDLTVVWPGPAADFLAQGAVEPRTHIRRQFDGLGIAEDFDGLLRLVNNHRAIFAVREMALQLFLDGRLELTVDIV